jgi:hypothetical protein
LSLVNFAGVLAIILKRYIIAMALLFFYTLIPLLRLIDGPVPGSLAFEIFTSFLRISLEKVMGGKRMLARQARQ